MLLGRCSAGVCGPDEVELPGSFLIWGGFVAHTIKITDKTHSQHTDKNKRQNSSNIMKVKQ